MSTMMEAMLGELREEAETTKRVLERVPSDKLTWRPHAKSMSLGELAMHLASAPAGVARFIQHDEFDISQSRPQTPQPATLAEIQAAFEQSTRAAEECLKGMSEQKAMANWRLLFKGKEVFARPRTEVLRKIMFNHLYHHRGQLSVYLRLLDVPVPVIYGKSADENPFA